jgi:hypothetical protein
MHPVRFVLVIPTLASIQRIGTSNENTFVVNIRGKPPSMSVLCSSKASAVYCGLLGTQVSEGVLRG